MERHGIISGKGLLPYLGLTLGIGAVALAVIRVGYMAGAALGCLPILLYIILFAIKKPYWAYTWLFIANYFVLGLTRYIPGLPAGIVMDCLIMFNLFTLLIRSCYKHVGWERARNGLTVASLVWLTYCFLELFNPQTVSATAWVALIRGYALYFVAIAILTPIIFYRYKDLKRILFIWSVLTLLAVLKSWIQRNIGFDQAEQYWLFVERGHTTHIIRTGVRYFSFFSDAANFGSSMGLSMVVFGIASLYYKNRWIRLYYIAVAAAACYGMMISGTLQRTGRTVRRFHAFHHPFQTDQNDRRRGIMLAGVFIFLNYTHIGHSNALIRRARSGLRPERRLFPGPVEKPGTDAGLHEGQAFRSGHRARRRQSENLRTERLPVANPDRLVVRDDMGRNGYRRADRTPGGAFLYSGVRLLPGDVPAAGQTVAGTDRRIDRRRIRHRRLLVQQRDFRPVSHRHHHVHEPGLYLPRSALRPGTGRGA